MPSQTTKIAQGFSDWISERPRGERVRVAIASDRVESWPVAAVAYELWNHDVTLPDHTATILGLPPDATYAHAARLLWCLREDPHLAVHNYQEAALTVAALSPDAFHDFYRAVDEAVRTVGTEQPWPDDVAVPVPAA